MIADLSKVWVYADIYEYELPWVKEGDPVEMQLAGIPGKTFNGHLAYIYPYAEAKTRTIKVRLIFDNPDLLLKPEMFAEVTIHAGKQVDAVVIPSEAVIRSGSRNQVFVVRAPGKFEPRLVTLGLSSNGRVAVLKGVNADEEIVVSAQYLIDSESKLREATAKMFQAVNDKKKSTELKKMTQQGIKIRQPESDSAIKQMNHQQKMSNNSDQHSNMEQMNHKHNMSANSGNSSEMKSMNPQMEMQHD
jgi:Cu(I)/Ag(I) efflux system membrane fusion protein